MITVVSVFVLVLSLHLCLCLTLVLYLTWSRFAFKLAPPEMRPGRASLAGSWKGGYYIDVKNQVLIWVCAPCKLDVIIFYLGSFVGKGYMSQRKISLLSLFFSSENSPQFALLLIDSMPFQSHLCTSFANNKCRELRVFFVISLPRKIGSQSFFDNYHVCS